MVGGDSCVACCFRERIRVQGFRNRVRVEYNDINRGVHTVLLFLERGDDDENATTVHCILY